MSLSDALQEFDICDCEESYSVVIDEGYEECFDDEPFVEYESEVIVSVVEGVDNEEVDEEFVDNKSTVVISVIEPEIDYEFID